MIQLSNNEKEKKRVRMLLIVYMGKAGMVVWLSLACIVVCMCVYISPVLWSTVVPLVVILETAAR